MDILSNNFYYRLFLCSKVANFAFDKSTQAQMKRFLTILAFLLAGTLVASAQNIIVGEKIPDLSLRKWLMDLPAERSEYTCYLFYHSESALCAKSLNAIKPLIKEAKDQLNLIIITKEEYENAGVTLTEHLDDNIYVAFDLQGRAFRSIGVDFIPFCVICDKKRRAMWCGNTMTLTQSVLDKILTTK